MNSVVVIDVGRTNLATSESYENLARAIAQRVDLGQRPVVVVGPQPADAHGRKDGPRAADRTATTRTGRGLLALSATATAHRLAGALHRLGRDAAALSGARLGLTVPSQAPGAGLSGMDGTAVREALHRHEVIVVPGGQAVDGAGRSVWLGEHGVDLSAVAIAAALGVGTCEIHSAAGGVRTADPELVPGAGLLPAVSWDSAELLGGYAAEPISRRAVRLARRHGVTMVHRRESEPLSGDGTVIGADGAPVVAVLHDRTARARRYATEEEADRAYAAFRDAGLNAVRPHCGPVVTVRGLAEPDAVERRAGLRGTPAGVPVTVVRGAEVRHHFAVDGDTALRLVGELHDMVTAEDQAAAGVR